MVDIILTRMQLLCKQKKQRMKSVNTAFFWPKNQNSFDSIANPPYRSLMEREKLRMESEKTEFMDKKIKISLTQ